MKNLLIATTALVATAGMASAEITFSGKGEAGMYRTAKSAAVAAVIGKSAASSATNNTSATSVIGVEYNTTTRALGAVAATATSTFAATGPSAELIANKKAQIAEQITLALADEAAAQVHRAATSNATNIAAYVVDADRATAHRAEAARLSAELVIMTGTAAVAAVKSSDMISYSGYDMNVAVSGESDNGIVFGMGFDMGAGLIADQNDDRAMDAQGAEIATSALTATMSGITLSIGSDKLDDVYDDTQNGDIGLSGNVGGIAFNLVHDLTDEVKAVAASAVYTTNTDATTAVIADLDTLVVTAATAATVETTSLSLGGAAGAVSYTFAATTGNDSGDGAAKGSLSYAGIENLKLTLAHDNAGKVEGISKVTVAYTMGDLKATVSMADDKDHVGNTNKNTKASSNLSLAYAANGLAATFATDESSQWWVNTQYDLGGGAQAFATIDHTEFAVVGLNFNF